MRYLCVLLAAVLLCAAAVVVADDPLNGGDPNCDGKNNVSDLTYMVNYLFKGGAAPCEVSPIGAPIAGGFIMSDASIISGSPNFTCVWNAAFQRYEITIEGYPYVYNQFITLVTSNSSERFYHVSSVNDKLIVYFRDISGNPVTAAFQFVTYAPGVLMSPPAPASNGELPASE